MKYPKKPLISIIVPIYNVEKYLRECLNSILNQTFKDIEVVCVNDGSPDNCLEILKDCQKRDKRIKIIDQENKGFGASMNIGLSKCKSKYVGIVEPDDYISERMYEKLFHEAEKLNTDIVKANFFILKNVKKSRGDRRIDLLKKSFFTNPSKHPLLFLGHPSIWAGLYRREFLERNKIRFVETPGASFQDIPFWFEVLSLCKKIKFIEDSLYYWRIHDDQSRSRGRKAYYLTPAFESLDNILKRRFLNNKKKYSLLYTIRIKRSIDDYKASYEKLSYKFKKELFRNQMRDFKNADMEHIIFSMLDKREKTMFNLARKGRFFAYFFTLKIYSVRNFFGKWYDRFRKNT